ncbi:MAG: VWA domain-containing protein [Planctomycetota bacterium]|nr:VWA domain-containing protein [Planctomycetota bacterium]
MTPRNFTPRNLALWVIPPWRRPLRLADTIAAGTTAALFLGGSLMASLAGWVLFVNPWVFLLTPIMLWAWWMHVQGFSGLVGYRGTMALVVRLLFVGLFILLFAEPRSVRKSENVAIVFAMDVSASIDDKAFKKTMTYVTKAVTNPTTGKPEKDLAGLVVFGREAAVELQPGTSFPYEAVTLQVDRDGTNLEKGLSLAAAMIPADAQGRVVLLTDGAQTEGNVKGTLDELKSRGVAVDILPIDYNFGQEVWLERIELPRFTKIGESYEAAVILSSLAAGQGELALKENDSVIFREQVKYSAGKNRYTIPIRLREPGYYEYTATIDPPPGTDGWPRNNKAISYLYLRGEGKVLLAVDPSSDAREYKDLVAALQASKRIVEIRSAYEFPTDALALLPYDCVVFPNVPADLFSPNQFAALKTAVYNQGTGFVMLGGGNSFGPGGYHRTPVEEILPVSMDVNQKKVMPKAALVIVLHTCEFPDGNDWAKKITKQAIRVLGKQDDVGALDYSYNGGVSWIFPLTPAGEYDKLATLINSASPGDMPSFHTIIDPGVTALEKSDAASKHMIVISDGDPQPPTNELLARCVAAKISISTVAIFPHDGQTQATLSGIASATGGRYYFPNDPNQLPAIFIKEAKTLRRSMVQEKTFTPQVSVATEILKGIQALPALRGYVLTTIKDRATLILRSPEQEEVEPVLATWRFGTGKTAAFTSDLSTKWGEHWVNWPRYQAFVQQLMTDVSRVNEVSNLRVQTYPAGSQGVIIVEDYAPEASFLDVRAQVAGPRGDSPAIALKQVAPRRYEGKFDLGGEGRYQVAAVGVGSGRAERVHGGFVVPYSQEYLRFRADPILLREIAERTGGRELTGKETGKELYDVKRAVKQSSKPLLDWFLLALAILLPLDVGLRRVQIDWQVVRNWMGMGRVAQPSQGTFDALRQRKESVTSVLKGKRGPVPPPIIRPDDDMPLAPRGDAPKTGPQTPGGAGPATPEKPGADGSTTGRLLAMKKKRDGGDA